MDIRFYVGSKCKRCKSRIRYKCSGNCVYCRRNSKKKEHRRERWRKWYRNNKGMINANRAKRRARKSSAVPNWADLNRIKEIYKNCPSGYHVDHIIPLNGKNVCGLHVEYNLQYLTGIENLKKGNTMGEPTNSKLNKVKQPMDHVKKGKLDMHQRTWGELPSSKSDAALPSTGDNLDVYQEAEEDCDEMDLSKVDNDNQEMYNEFSKPKQQQVMKNFDFSKAHDDFAATVISKKKAGAGT